MRTKATHVSVMNGMMMKMTWEMDKLSAKHNKSLLSQWVVLKGLDVLGFDEDMTDPRLRVDRLRVIVIRRSGSTRWKWIDARCMNSYEFFPLARSLFDVEI